MQSAQGEPHIELSRLHLAFGRRVVYRDLSARFERARVSAVMGGSGTGKSTLLRIIGGLQAPASGHVTVAGESILGADRATLARVRRRIGMLFQNGALLDSMSIYENIALPLREHTALTQSEIEKAVHERIEAVGLEDVDDLLPGELSGGMLRRAALARAIVMDPEILLCDEPFSGLDPPNVDRIEALLSGLSRDLGLTVVLTSHHVQSARRMAHQIVLLLDGGAVSGTPVELSMSPDVRVTDFLRVDATGLKRGDLAMDVG